MQKLMVFYSSKWFNVYLFVVFLCLPFLMYWDLFIANKSLVAGDGVQYYSLKSFISSSLAQGEFPFWNKYLTNGTPFASDLTNNAFYPLAIVLSFLPLKLFMYSYYAFHLAIGAFFIYLFIKEIGCGKAVALCTAFIYELSIHVGGFRKEHITIIATIVYLPVILYFIQRYINTKSRKWLLFSSAAMAFQFYVAFIQDVVYTDISVGVFLLTLAFHSRIKIKRIFFDCLMWVGCYFGLIAFQFLPTIELVREYGRDGATSATLEYFQSYSIHFSKLVMMLFPRFFGGEVFQSFGTGYSSELDIEIFLGAFIVLIILFGVFSYLNDFRVRLSLGMMVGAFIFSANAHVPFLSELLYRIPGINGFRVPSRALFIFVFFALILFAVTLSKLRAPEHMGKLHRFTKWFWLGLCTLIGLAFFSNAVNLISVSNYEGAKALYQYFKSTFLSSLVIISSAYLLVHLIYKSSANWSKVQYNRAFAFFGIIILLCTIWETYSFTTFVPTNNIKNINEFTSKDRVSQFIADNIGDSKVWDASIDPNENFDLNVNLFKKYPVINAYISFNNPKLYKLMNNDNNQVPLNNSGLLRFYPNAKSTLVMQNDLLSMLGIKYIIDNGNIPIGESGVKTTWQDVGTIFAEDKISIPISKEELSIYSHPINIKPNTFYIIQFELTSDGKQRLFYVDFYGGEKYDQAEQQKVFDIGPGSSRYSAVFNSGDTTGVEDINLRIISSTTSNVVINSFTLKEINIQKQGGGYKPVLVEGTTKVYENTNVKSILYVPQKTESIEDANDIYSNQYKYYLSNVSYIENFKSMDLTDANTTVSVKEFKNNSITGLVQSDRPSFINFSQNYYPGWKAKVNGKETPVYMVNGLIQGIEVPAGDSEIKFYFYPKIFFVGGIISLLTLLIISFLIIKENKALKRPDSQNQ